MVEECHHSTSTPDMQGGDMRCDGLTLPLCSHRKRRGRGSKRPRARSRSAKRSPSPSAGACSDSDSTGGLLEWAQHLEAILLTWQSCLGIYESRSGGSRLHRPKVVVKNRMKPLRCVANVMLCVAYALSSCATLRSIYVSVDVAHPLSSEAFQAEAVPDLRGL